jgi:hypothetical protein
LKINDDDNDDDNSFKLVNQLTTGDGTKETAFFDGEAATSSFDKETFLWRDLPAAMRPGDRSASSGCSATFS